MPVFAAAFGPAGAAEAAGAAGAATAAAAGAAGGFGALAGACAKTVVIPESEVSTAKPTHKVNFFTLNPKVGRGARIIAPDSSVWLSICTRRSRVCRFDKARRFRNNRGLRCDKSTIFGEEKWRFSSVG